MRILIVTPPRPSAQSGNHVTASRWARILRELGHVVHLGDAYRGESFDVLVALHARRSARSVERFHRERPGSPLVLAMTGTDLYRDIEKSHSAQLAMELASRLLLLQFDGLSRLPKSLAHKARVIYQSAEPPSRVARPLTRFFEICVIGHLRSVKDPFRAALAARRLPASSRIRVVQLGKALESSMQRRALAEMQVNRRYRWHGEWPWRKAQQQLARARLLVLSSKMEGGANVLSEALAAGVPVLGSRISGTMGLLGERYPGYFPVGDTTALAALMHRAEIDGGFYQQLQEHCAERARLVAPEKEKRDWAELLGEFLWEACGSPPYARTVLDGAPGVSRT